MHRVYDFNGVCPYTDRCDSFQTISRAERWMEEALLRMRKESVLDPSAVDGEPSIYTLQWRLEHMRRVKERCYSYCHRCLRFRQFNSREGEGAAIPQRDLAWTPAMEE